MTTPQSADVPAAPDGTARLVGEARRPDPPAVRGPEAGVPDLSGMRLLEELRSGAGEQLSDGDRAHAEEIRFQHPSERRFARLLDFYRIGWEYEPDVFPIEWGDAGEACGYFRPDFYLPAFDLYIEITTSQQRLVTKKNRKLRLLRAHHPDVRCKLFYQRDYYELVRKFGLDEDLGDDEEL